MTVLVCAATRTELAACSRGIRAGGGRAPSFETLLTGVGPARAEKSLAERLARGTRPTLIVSSGLAGALGPGIEIGSWVTARRVAEMRGESEVEVAHAVLREAPEPARAYTVLSSPQLLQTEVRLPADGATPAVDMESAALARGAAAHGIAFMVLRLVSDTPAHPLPRFLSPFTAAMAATNLGSIIANTARGVGGALGDPGGVVRLVREGNGWTRELAAGWERFAPTLG